MRETVAMADIKKALVDGLKKTEDTLNMTPHDMNKEMMDILKRYFNPDLITLDLFSGGVVIMYFTQLEEARKSFKDQQIPEAMAGFCAMPIMNELKNLNGVGKIFMEALMDPGTKV